MIKGQIHLAAVLLLVGSCPPRPADAQTQDARQWVFIGLLAYETVPGCVNKIASKTGYAWLRRDASFKLSEQTLRGQVEAHGAQLDTKEIPVSATTPRVVALVAKTRKCGDKRPVSHSWYYGDDETDLRKRIAADLKSVMPWSVVSWEIVGPLFDGRTEVKKLNDQRDLLVVGKKIEF